MEVLFFNYWSTGDSFIFQEILKHICSLNPTIQFSFFGFNNSYLFENIPNLKVLTKDIQFTKELQSSDNPSAYLCLNDLESLKNILEKNTALPYFKINDSLFAINMWCSAYHQYNPPADLECNIIHIQSVFIKALQDIQPIVHLEYTPLTPYQLIPDIHLQVPISFMEWQLQNADKFLVFYYNYEGRSGQCSIENEEDHTTILLNLAERYKSFIFLVPRCSASLKARLATLQITNIIDCRERFGLVETPSCLNLVALATITTFCSISIHYDIGACFYYFNKQMIFNKTNNTIIQFGRRPYYADQFHHTIQASGVPTDFQIYHFGAFSAEQVIDKLNTLIPAFQTIKRYI